MAGEMSWRSGASSRLSSVKGYLSQRPEVKQILSYRRHQPQETADGQSTTLQGLREWAGQKIRGQGHDVTNTGVDKISLFPGWATRRYRNPEGGGLEESFNIEVFVSGFAVNQRGPESATRSQRAFMRVAKGFAKLQPLSAKPHGQQPTISSSTEKLLASIQMPPRPTEITDDFDMEALEKQFQRANVSGHLTSSVSSTHSDDNTLSSSSSDSESVEGGEQPHTPTGEKHHDHPAASISSDLHRLHANLEARLQPFWSTALSARTIQISLFAAPKPEHHSNDENDNDFLNHGPVATQEVLTTSDGSFQARFTVSWEKICQHPHALHIAFGDPLVEHDLVLSASLLPLPSLTTPTPEPPPPTPPTPSPPATTQIRISLTQSPIRVVSDIDDTVKLSNILSGARAVFHNVFVKELKDSVIPGMGPWYGDMYKRGVRFHYVSNGPFELLPVVNEFLHISQLPPGSVKLKSYAGRSLFNGLLSAPATRKRAGVVDVLDSFPISRFMLVGDTGEQDLELFSVLASERPMQILGVFVRDAGVGEVDGEEVVVGPVDDPTGWKGVYMERECGGMGTGEGRGSPPETPTSGGEGKQHSRPAFLSKTSLSETLGSITSLQPLATQSMELSLKKMKERKERKEKQKQRSEPSPRTEQFTAAPPPYSRSSTLPITEEPGVYSSGADAPVSSSSHSSRSSSKSGRRPSMMTEVEKRRDELQQRVVKARSIMPDHIPLRVFRSPEECVEVWEILDKLHVGAGGGSGAGARAGGM